MSGKQQNQSGKLPKNIRQIGTNMGNTRIYLEDYVFTYLHNKEEQENWTHRGFLLLGRLEHEQNYTRYFISGLIRLEDSFFKEDILEFHDKTWAYIYQEMKKYYDELEIVGWGQDISGSSAGLAAELERNHKQNFNIQKNVMLLLDLSEQEDAFYVFEKNTLQRREGYYVYYEKNPQMQEYMIQTRKESELKMDTEQLHEPDAAIDYREILQFRKSQMSSQKWNGVLYATSLLMVLSVCVLGVSTVNNVKKMQHLENKVAGISDDGQQQDAEYAAMSQNVQEEHETYFDEEDIAKRQVESDSSDMEITTDTDTETDVSKTESAEEKNDEEKTNENAVKKSNQEQEESSKDENKTTTEEISSDSLPETKDDQEETALTEAQTWLLQGYYIVKKGDSLVRISQRIYGTTEKVDSICELNGIEDVDKIYEGQKLLLP